jgi:hypothetical protein
MPKTKTRSNGPVEVPPQDPVGDDESEFGEY